MTVKKPILTKDQLAQAIISLTRAPKHEKFVMRRDQRIKIGGVLLHESEKHAAAVARVELSLRHDVGILARKNDKITGFNIFIRQGSGISLGHLVSWLRVQEAQLQELPLSPEMDDLLIYEGQPIVGGQKTPWKVDYDEHVITSATYKGTPTIMNFRQVCATIVDAVQVGRVAQIKEPSKFAVTPMTSAPQPTA